MGYFLDRRDFLLKAAPAHFWFEAGGRRYCYSYIRKNACSSFRKFIIETSSEADFGSFSGPQIEFLRKYHLVRTYECLERCDASLFVFRDPYERLISAYLNKFVARRGNADLFRDFRTTLGKDPESASFRDFVDLYCIDFARRDVHVLPQASHLLPIFYDHALPMEDLHSLMADLIGPKSAGRFFASPVNASEHAEDRSAGISLCDVPAEELRAEFLRSTALPPKNCFVDDALKGVVAQRYHADYRMIGDICGASNDVAMPGEGP